MVLPSFSVCFNSIQTSLLLNWLGVARRAVILCSGEVVEGTVLEYSGGWEGVKESSVWWLGA